MPINADYRGPGDLPEIIPVFPLAGALLLPRGQLPLNIFEPRYLMMIDDAFASGPRLRVTSPPLPRAGRPPLHAPPHPHRPLPHRCRASGRHALSAMPGGLRAV